MRVSELRTLRHLALSIAEQCAALLELVDGAMPTADGPAISPAADVPQVVVDAGEALIAEARTQMFGAARRAAEAAATVPATAPETGTAEVKPTD